MSDLVRLKHADGTMSDWMPRERADFIVAFTFTGESPKIIGNDEEHKTGEGRPTMTNTPVDIRNIPDELWDYANAFGKIGNQDMCNKLSDIADRLYNYLQEEHNVG